MIDASAWNDGERSATEPRLRVPARASGAPLKVVDCPVAAGCAAEPLPETSFVDPFRLRSGISLHVAAEGVLGQRRIGEQIVMQRPAVDDDERPPRRARQQQPLPDRPLKVLVRAAVDFNKAKAKPARGRKPRSDMPEVTSAA